jgi:hypothetical protein
MPTLAEFVGIACILTGFGLFLIAFSRYDGEQPTYDDPPFTLLGINREPKPWWRNSAHPFE